MSDVSYQNLQRFMCCGPQATFNRRFEISQRQDQGTRGLSQARAQVRALEPDCLKTNGCRREKSFTSEMVMDTPGLSLYKPIMTNPLELLEGQLAEQLVCRLNKEADGTWQTVSVPGHEGKICFVNQNPKHTEIGRVGQLVVRWHGKRNRSFCWLLKGNKPWPLKCLDLQNNHS